jgi:hypothetical protein
MRTIASEIANKLVDRMQVNTVVCTADCVHRDKGGAQPFACGKRRVALGAGGWCQDWKERKADGQ